MSTNSSEQKRASSSGCMAWVLFLASLSLNALLLTGCLSPYRNALRELAGEKGMNEGFVNPFSSSDDAKRLKSVIEKRLHSAAADSEEKTKGLHPKGFDDGKKEGQSNAKKECTKQLLTIAQVNVDVGAEDAFEKTLAGVKQRIEALEKGQGEESARPRRLMRDIADKLGVPVNKDMGINDLHRRIVVAVEAETKMPQLISDNEIKAALEETSWKKAFGEYHEFLKQLSGKRIIVIPISSGSNTAK